MVNCLLFSHASSPAYRLQDLRLPEERCRNGSLMRLKWKIEWWTTPLSQLKNAGSRGKWILKNQSWVHLSRKGQKEEFMRLCRAVLMRHCNRIRYLYKQIQEHHTRRVKNLNAVMRIGWEFDELFSCWDRRRRMAVYTLADVSWKNMVCGWFGTSSHEISSVLGKCTPYKQIAYRQ